MSGARANDRPALLDLLEPERRRIERVGGPVQPAGPGGDDPPDLVADALNGRRQSLNGARVLILGVAYKRGVADTRESPAIDVIERLLAKGASVTYADPYVPSIAIGPSVLKSVDLDPVTIKSADCVLILTDHREFPYELVVHDAALVVDARNATYGLPAVPGHVISL